MELVKQIREGWRCQTEASEVEVSNKLLEPLAGGEKDKVQGESGPHSRSSNYSRSVWWELEI